MRQKAIGGYFSLELPYNNNGEYHRNAIRLNSGRYCLEYVLRVKKYKKVYLPYYMCDAVLQPINKLGLDYQFYHIDRYFHISETLHPKRDEVILYCNYFGLMDEYVKIVTDRYAPNIIIDNTQAFFSRPLPEIDTFYTCRKFFGVADGAYLYTDKEADFDIPQDYSSSRMLFLLDRLDKSAEEAFCDYHKNEDFLDHDTIKRMSKVTQTIMSSIDYRDIAGRRLYNFDYLNDKFGLSNGLEIHLEKGSIPMIYPYFVKDENLRKKLIDHKIYIPSYWPNVSSWCNSIDIETYFSYLLLPLPVDQRYGIEDMDTIHSVITEVV